MASRADVPTILERLGIKATRVAQRPNGKFESACPHPAHRSNPHAWHIKDEPGRPMNGYHSCLSCDFKGGIYKLVMTVTGCDVDEAREFLNGEEAARPIPDSIELEFVSPKTKFRLPDCVRFVPWHEWPKGATDYLYGRGHDETVMGEFGFGFVDEDETDVVEGETVPHRLRERIVIPFRDHTQRVLTYTARSWNAGAKKRYLEPRRTDRPEPGAIFGEHLWRAAETVVVAEGSFDAVALSRVLDDPRVDVGALAGSSLDTLQVEKILRGRQRVVCVTDPDRAGLKAADDLKARVVRRAEFVRVDLPSGMDAAKMAIDDPDELFRRVATAAGII